MTFKEFKKKILEISGEQFQAVQFHPLEHGIRRALFEENKLKRMIAIGRRSDCETAKRRVAAWQRQLQRVQQTRKRLENTRDGIFAPAPAAAVPTQEVLRAGDKSLRPVLSAR